MPAVPKGSRRRHDEPARSRGGVPPAPAEAHEWLSLDDPDEDRTWLLDVTFLASSWACIYGNGCQGVLTGPAPELEQGCCSYGAHFVDDDDVRRVEAAARTLTDEQWQFRSAAQRRTKGGRARGVTRRDAAGTVTTRLVDDACIFLNRPGFAGGPGCALHRAALERSVPPLELKPDVCWQLPLRREDTVDDDGHVTTKVSEWQRRHWGEGGAEFHWWCTEAPEAFGATRPVYETMRDELVAITGEAVYDLLRAYLARRAAGSGTVLLPHPAVRRAGGATAASKRSD